MLNLREQNLRRANKGRNNMQNASQIREHMEVIGSDGQRVGTVDNVEGNRIKLTKNDPQAQGQHRYIPFDMVESVDQNAVRLNISAEQARRQATSDDAR